MHFTLNLSATWRWPPPNPQLTTAHVRPQALVVGSPKPLPLLVAVSSSPLQQPLLHTIRQTQLSSRNKTLNQLSKAARCRATMTGIKSVPGSKILCTHSPPFSSPLSPYQARPLNQLAAALGYQPFELPAIYRLPHWAFCAARLPPPSHVWSALHNASLAFRLIHMMHAYACISVHLYVSS